MTVPESFQKQVFAGCSWCNPFPDLVGNNTLSYCLLELVMVKSTLGDKIRNLLFYCVDHWSYIWRKERLSSGTLYERTEPTNGRLPCMLEVPELKRSFNQKYDDCMTRSMTAGQVSALMYLQNMEGDNIQCDEQDGSGWWWPGYWPGWHDQSDDLDVF